MSEARTFSLPTRRPLSEGPGLPSHPQHRIPGSVLPLVPSHLAQGAPSGTFPALSCTFSSVSRSPTHSPQHPHTWPDSKVHLLTPRCLPAASPGTSTPPTPMADTGLPSQCKSRPFLLEVFLLEVLPPTPLVQGPLPRISSGLLAVKTCILGLHPRGGRTTSGMLCLSIVHF